MKTTQLMMAVAATSMMLAMSACSSNEDVTEQPASAYVWGTDGSIKTCDHLTFALDDSEDTNGTVIGPMGRDGFVNNADYINGSVFPQNGSALGKFQSAMQIRRSSRLACFNSVAVGYPIGLIVDGEKGNTQEVAKADGLKLQSILFAGMGITGSDANKR